MPQYLPIILTASLAIVFVTLTLAQGNENQLCKCHPFVGNADIIFSRTPLHEPGAKPVRIRFYFDYNKKHAVGYGDGKHEIDWFFFDGNEKAHYERKRDGTCIKYPKEYPLSPCMPDDAEYLGVSNENGVEVVGWKKDSEIHSY